MKIKTQLTLLFVLFGLTLSQAQTMVSGTVLGKDGQPPLFLKSKKKLKKSLTILENILNVNCITFNIFFK